MRMVALVGKVLDARHHKTIHLQMTQIFQRSGWAVFNDVQA